MTEIGDLFSFPKSFIVNAVVRYVKKMVPKWNIPNATTFNSTLKAGHRLKLAPVTITGDDLAYLQYTGGTTGVAKGAELTHRNMIANIEQAAAWFKPVMKEGEEIIVTALPLYHIFSLTGNCWTFIRAGALNILITNPRDIPEFIKEISKAKFTAITGVNTLFNAMMNHPTFKNIDFSNLRLVVGGAMAVQRVVAERWQKLTGAPLLEGYGLTETSPLVSVVPLNATEYTGSIGLPAPSTDVSIRDKVGNELGIGERGELYIKGPQVMKGYWKRPDETAKVLSEDGWLRTGDVATIDEKGFLRIVDRIKDMIVVSGFNVYPNEVEDVIAHHPGVLEVGVVGVPHEVSGEMVKAFIVKKDPDLQVESIIAHCRQHLTAYKIPKRVEFREELPKSPIGKILRRELRDKD